MLELAQVTVWHSQHVRNRSERVHGAVKAVAVRQSPDGTTGACHWALILPWDAYAVVVIDQVERYAQGIWRFEVLEARSNDVVLSVPIRLTQESSAPLEQKFDRFGILARRCSLENPFYRC